MATEKSTTNKKLIIVGGGFAGLQLIKSLRNKDIDITLIDKHNYFTFQPLLYQVATGGLSPDTIAYPIRKLTGKTKNITFRMTEVTAVIPQQNKVVTGLGEFHYDYLLLATGAANNFFRNDELEKNCLPLKSISDALNIRSDILQEFEKAITIMNKEDVDRVLNFVVVGGGPTGVETAGALAEMKKHVLPADYPELDGSWMQVHLVEAGEEILQSFHDQLSARALQSLKKLGVQVWLNTRVESYDGKMLKLSGGKEMLTDTVIWAAGVKGNVLEGFSADQSGKAGRLKVDAYSRLEGSENIFAVGDVAYMTADKKYPEGHPMVGQVAIQQARLFSKNIFRLLRKEQLKPFAYFDLGSMATIGRHKAVFEFFGIRLSGILAWYAWMALHLMLLVGFRNRLVALVNWAWSYFTYDRAIRIIIRPFRKEEDKNFNGQ